MGLFTLQRDVGGSFALPAEIRLLWAEVQLARATWEGKKKTLEVGLQLLCTHFSSNILQYYHSIAMQLYCYMHVIVEA